METRAASSGSSGGDVQKRIIGYYEAWAHDRSCAGMTFKDIPVESLTHLNFAFGYIQPGTFEVVPMDDLPPSLFSDLTALKSRNRGLKAIISLGGWTFNDNGTSTQPVFSDMVSSAGNRKKFIGNLFSFMGHYGFDGVDIDWVRNSSRIFSFINLQAHAPLRNIQAPLTAVAVPMMAKN
jgi:chitinase